MNTSYLFINEMLNIFGASFKEYDFILSNTKFNVVWMKADLTICYLVYSYKNSEKSGNFSTFFLDVVEFRSL